MQLVLSLMQLVLSLMQLFLSLLQLVVSFMQLVVSLMQLVLPLMTSLHLFEDGERLSASHFCVFRDAATGNYFQYQHSGKSLEGW
jgi:hypothetical protein